MLKSAMFRTGKPRSLHRSTCFPEVYVASGVMWCSSKGYWKCRGKCWFTKTEMVRQMTGVRIRYLSVIRGSSVRRPSTALMLGDAQRDAPRKVGVGLELDGDACVVAPSHGAAYSCWVAAGRRWGLLGSCREA